MKEGGAMPAKAFDASKYLTDLHGREYLEVKWRLLWLRTEHADAVVHTELVKHAPGLALFRARVAIPGAGEATGWGSETADDFEDYIEKAETKALGRALAALGYGTQFCEDFDFSAERRKRQEPRRSASPAASDGSAPRNGERRRSPRVVDAPVARRTLKVVRDGEAQGPPPGATAPQVKAIYSIGRGQSGLGEAGVEERCKERYGCLPPDLSKRQASEFIDLLRRPASEPAVAGVAKAST
jgi:hypothetical protein